MKQLPTVREFLNEYLEKMEIESDYINEHLPFLLKEFAKLHVQQALESVSEVAKIDFLDGLGGEGTKEVGISKQSILNAYLLENIK